MDKEDWIELSDLQGRVKECISDAFLDSLWVRAEVSEVKNHPSGHCYLTLIEKDADSTYIKAKASAIIWSSTYRVLRPFFVSATGSEFAVGMNILVRVQVQYSEVYGLSLIIYDIDPAFTMGGLETERQRTIDKLKAEGMFDMNKSLELPALPVRFAVITSETAAGYRDFMRHLHENEYGYRFHTDLYPALMQGVESPKSIIEALDNVASSGIQYDAVLILRGGGGAMDLVCFDDYDLAVNVAQFPFPVLTGIGHDHDYHVIDMVAFENVKTPTALADFIIGLHAEQEYRLDSLTTRLRIVLKSKSQSQFAVLQQFVIRMKNAVGMKTLTILGKLDQFESRVKSVNPQAILEKGYAIVLKDGRIAGSVKGLAVDDQMKILFKDGAVVTKITSIDRR